MLKEITKIKINKKEKNENLRDLKKLFLLLLEKSFAKLELEDID
ncbi:MAG: hypothetical protein PHF49_01740 [Patescibacteria group bacterium]|nr:hypothetical protein [Patescibacteria group bacterium]